MQQCSECRFGKERYGGQIECCNVEAKQCTELMDADDSCELYKQKKVMKSKHAPIVDETYEHIPNPELPKWKIDTSKKEAEKPKPEKNYKQKTNNKTNKTKIYVITQNGHIAGYGDVESGFKKHVYFHEELSAISYCKKQDKARNKKYKYGYVECIIQGEPEHWYEDKI